MPLRHLAAAFVFLACASAAHAKAPPRIDVLDKCKRGAACIDAEVNIENLEERTIGAMTDVCKGPIIRLRGRLNGGRVADYRVGFKGVCMDCGDSSAAYVGQSGAGNPVVLTNAGRFEIVDKTVSIGAPDNLITIDMKSGEIIGKYWGDTHFAAAFFVVKGRVYLLGDGTCFVAPASAPRRFTIAPGGKCVQKWHTRQLHLNQLDAEPPPAVVETLTKLYQKGRTYSVGPSFHARGTNMWVVQFGEPCM